MPGAGEKTEKATGRRRKQERSQGNVLTSKDVTMVFSLLVMCYSLQFLGGGLVTSLQDTLISFINKGATVTVVEPSIVTQLLIEIILGVALALLPLLFISILANVAITMTQTRLLVTTATMKFKFSKMNPINGLKGLFSLKGFVEFVKSLVKFAVVLIVVLVVLSERIMSIPDIFYMSINDSLTFLVDTAFSLITTVGIIFIGVAILDYFYQKYEYEKKMRMSKDDIKEEYKQTEGDPKIKSKRKHKQIEMARMRMMQAVPTADVIIRNPTHYAIAISYDQKKHAAPVVVAKGADYLALKIIDVAKEHDVVITENKPLARSLYESVELEHPIPEKFYSAVAEVLAFVYKLKKKDLK